MSKNASVEHQCWKKNVAEMYRIAGYKVKEEVPMEGGSGDLVAKNENETIAIEIETGKSDAVRNIRKDLKAGFEKVVVSFLIAGWRRKFGVCWPPRRIRR
jgi:hypothetical protein